MKSPSSHARRTTTCTLLAIVISGPALATVIGFEDVAVVDYVGVPSGYEGFTWLGSLEPNYQSWLISSKFGPHGTIGANAHSGNNFGWNNSGATLTLSAAAPFTFNSAWIATWAGQGVTTTAEGFRSGSLIYSQTIPVSSTYKQVTLDYVGVDTVRFSGGHNFVFDDITVNSPVSTPVAKRTFGLFLGVSDKAENNPNAVTYRGDRTATTLNQIWQSQNLKSELITRNADSGEFISQDEILGKLKVLLADAKPGDSLLIYAGGHGASVRPGDNLSNEEGQGSDFVSLGKGSGFSDAALTSLLWKADPSGMLTKKVFIDACHAGGFWSSGDPLEATMTNLNDVANTFLYASSAEKDKAYFSPVIGESFFGQALEDALSSGIYFESTPSELADYIQKQAIKHATILFPAETKFYEQGFGDAIAADASLIKTYFTSNVSSVPEPASGALFIFGVVFTLLRRLKY